MSADQRTIEHHVACIVSVTGGLEGPCDCGAEQKLMAVLGEARAFVGQHSERWYYSGQALLGRLSAAMGEPCPPPYGPDERVTDEMRKARQYAIDAWVEYNRE